MKKFNVTLSRIYVFDAVDIEANNIEEAIEIAKEKLNFNNFEIEENYTKVCDESGQLIYDTEVYSGWSIADVESVLEEKINEYDSLLPEEQVYIIKFKALSEDKKKKFANDIADGFIRHLDFSDHNIALSDLVEDKLSEL